MTHPRFCLALFLCLQYFQGNFYKTFTRPVTKVLLMAVFTYQLAYWGWVKLEQDEIRADREGMCWFSYPPSPLPPNNKSWSDWTERE